MTTTEIHAYNAPAKGTEDWDGPLNENFEQFDADIEVRDEGSNGGSYTAKQGAKLLATHPGKVIVGDGTEWFASLALPRAEGTYIAGSAGNVVNGHPNNGVGDGVGTTTVGGSVEEAP